MITRLEMVRMALTELGSQATNVQVSAFVLQCFRAKVDPAYVPIFRATLRGEEELRKARELVAQVAEEMKKGKKKAG